MYCFQQAEPYCMHFNIDDLRIGEICYRFCEDNTEPMINHMNDCPQGSTCLHRPNTVGYDSCGTNAWRCTQPH